MSVDLMLSLSIALLASSPRSSLRADRPVSGSCAARPPPPPPPPGKSSSVLRISLTSELSESVLEAVRRTAEEPLGPSSWPLGP
jgi:hypothetical protein